MSDLTVAVGPEIHEFVVGRQPWSAGGALLPDVWAHVRSVGSVIVADVEVSLASFVMGQKARTTVGAQVSVRCNPAWTLVHDCERPWPNVWYPMHAACRRYAMFPTANPELRPQAEALARGGYYRGWGANRLAYGPCGMPLPNLTSAQRSSMAARVSGWRAHLSAMLQARGPLGGVEDSQDGIFYQRDGWLPWGIQDRGTVGGSGIYFWTGNEQAPDSPAYCWLVACANHERRWHAYHRETGEVITAQDYGDPGPKYQEGTGDPNNGWLPEFAGVASNPDPLPLPFDASHSVRGFRHLIALSEMVDWPIVGRMLASQAAQFRLQYSDMGPHPQPGYTPPALRTSLEGVRANPGVGFFGLDSGRWHGWPAYLIAQSVKKGCAINLPWTNMLVDLAATAAMPSGIFSRAAADPGSIWYDPANDTAQAFEVPIFWSGAIGCAVVSNRTSDPVFASMISAAANLYEVAPKWQYYGGNVGPPHFMYVAARGGAPYRAIHGGKSSVQPPGDSTHSSTGLALAAAFGDRSRWLKDSASMGAAFSDWQSKMATLETWTDLRDDAGLLAQMQRAP